MPYFKIGQGKDAHTAGTILAKFGIALVATRTHMHMRANTQTHTKARI
jgi:hypothetical protein